MLNDYALFSMRSLLFLWITVCLPATTTHAQDKKMPPLVFTTTEGNLLTPKQLPAGSPLLLAYFRTDCDLCRFMARKIKEEVASYPLQVWMVSPESRDQLSVFEEMNALYDLPNLVVARDHSKRMHQWFQFEQIPYYVLFNREGKQIASFQEWPSLTEIKRLLAAH